MAIPSLYFVLLILFSHVRFWGQFLTLYRFWEKSGRMYPFLFGKLE